MIKVLWSLVFIALVLPTYEQDTPYSPCPNVFMYESTEAEPGRWYGVVNLSTDSTLHSLWLNIVLDQKADILGNWIGDVTTTDNIDFKIENTKMKIHPGTALAVKFFVQYNTLSETPKLSSIRLNGREICGPSVPIPANDLPDIASRPGTVESRPATVESRPATVESRPETITSRPETITSRPATVPSRPVVRPGLSPEARPTPRPSIRPSNNDSPGPVYVRPETPAVTLEVNPGFNVDQSVVRPSSNFLPTATVAPHRGPQIVDVSTGSDEDYFTGGRPTFFTPNRPGDTNNWSQPQGESNECGKVVLNNAIPLVLNGTPTLEGQWPWQIALYQTQTVDNKYICGGTLVSHSHVITAAHCITRKNSNRIVDASTLTVYLGKHNLRNSVNGVAVRFVDEIILHPQYNASSYSRDVAILKLRERVTYSDWIKPACLWPENQISINSVIGKRGSVVGWGFDDTGVATAELNLVEMPVVDTETCIRSYSEFFVRFTSDYTYCAGYRDGTSVCNGDSGGGMVFKMSNSWYLRGLVSLSVARQNEYRCDPSHYVIFTDLAKFLPWIKNNINDY